MPALKIILDQETLNALEARAKAELRPADFEAVVLLRTSLGLAFPFPTEKVSDDEHTMQRGGQN